MEPGLESRPKNNGTGTRAKTDRAWDRDQSQGPEMTGPGFGPGSSPGPQTSVFIKYFPTNMCMCLYPARMFST